MRTWFLVVYCTSASLSTPLPPLPDLTSMTSMLGAVPSLLQTAVVGGTTSTTGGTTAVVTAPATTTTTVPAMMTMAPMLPAVALGIVKAIFISKFENINILH